LIFDVKLGVLHELWLKFLLVSDLKLVLDLTKMLFQIVILFFESEHVFDLLVLVHVSFILFDYVKVVNFILKLVNFFLKFEAFSLFVKVFFNLDVFWRIKLFFFLHVANFLG